MKKRVLFLSVLAWACQNKQESAKKSQITEIPVEVNLVKPKTYIEYGYYIGEIKAIRQITLKTIGGGRASKILVNRGDQINKGQKLCDIQSEKFNALYQSTKLAMEIAQNNYNLAKRHLEKGTSSRLKVSKTHQEFLKKKSQRIDALEQKKGANCISPIGGTVVDRHFDIYDQLQPGQETLTIADLSQVRIAIGIPETQISGYRIGNRATIEIPGFSAGSWSGEISSLAQSVSAKTKTFTAEIDLDNTRKELKPGMSVQVVVLRYSLDNQIVIPSNTILIKGKEKIVMIAKDGLAQKRPILIFSQNETQTRIKSGLKVGDSLIVKGHSQVISGSAVKINHMSSFVHD